MPALSYATKPDMLGALATCFHYLMLKETKKQSEGYRLF